MKRNEYVSPLVEVVPYRSLLMVLPPSAETGIDQEDILSKKFDDFEENDSYEDELWKDEREGSGLQDWDTNYEQ